MTQSNDDGPARNPDVEPRLDARGRMGTIRGPYRLGGKEAAGEELCRIPGGGGGPRPMYVRRLLVIVFWAAMLFAFMMALLPKPPQIPGNPGDKFQHIAAFAILTVLACAAYPSATALRIAAGLSAFGLLIELCQAIPALHRDASALDWIVDVAAVVVVLVLTKAVRRGR